MDRPRPVQILAVAGQIFVTFFSPSLLPFYGLNIYRLITAYLLLRVNCDKMMHVKYAECMNLTILYDSCQYLNMYDPVLHSSTWNLKYIFPLLVANK